jgi:hypothetical protein
MVVEANGQEISGIFQVFERIFMPGFSTFALSFVVVSGCKPQQNQSKERP